MKKFFILAIVMLCSTMSFSQALTKLQTLDYLNTKLNETADLSRHYNAESTYTVSNVKIKTDPYDRNKVVVSFNRKFSTGEKDLLEYIFDPTYISLVQAYSNTYNDALGLMQVKLSAAIVILRQTYSSGSLKIVNQESLSIPYFSSEKINTERLEKALQHLKKLFIESKERDPFLN